MEVIVQVRSDGSVIQLKCCVLHTEYDVMQPQRAVDVALVRCVSLSYGRYIPLWGEAEGPERSRAQGHSRTPN